jgi:hypothetical protein
VRVTNAVFTSGMNAAFGVAGVVAAGGLLVALLSSPPRLSTGTRLADRPQIELVDPPHPLAGGLGMVAELLGHPFKTAPEAEVLDGGIDRGKHRLV